MFRPEREAQVIDGLKARQPGPAEDRQRGADLARDHVGLPRAGGAHARGLPGPGRHLQRTGRAGLLRLVASCACPAPASTRCSAPPPPAPPISAWCRWRTPPRAWWPARSTCSCTRRCSSSARPACSVRHNLLRTRQLARGHQGGAGAPAGAGAVPRLAEHHLPDAERRPVSSNAEGARLASLDPSLAAIASERAGSEFGLHVVAPAIQDDAHNRTRFAIVTHPQRHPAPKASGHDCTSLVVSVTNRPGAVHDMLVPLKKHGVSMTRFESRPARSGQWEYYFYIDIEGHPDEPHVARALARAARRVRLLQGAGHLPDRRALKQRHGMFNQLGVIGCGLMGGSLRAGAQARRAGQARGGLQQVAVDHRAGQAAGRDRRRRRVGAAGGVGLGHRADRGAGGGHRGHASRPSATWSSPACWSWTWAAPSATWSTPRGACCASASARFVPAHPIAGKEVVGHRARRCRRCTSAAR